MAIGLSEDSNGYHDYSDFSGIPNNAGSGVTGDIDFTTVGHGSGDTYMIILELSRVMADTSDVTRTKSGRLTYRGESFPIYNKQVRDSGGRKKFKVLAKRGRSGEDCSLW